MRLSWFDVLASPRIPLVALAALALTPSSGDAGIIYKKTWYTTKASGGSEIYAGGELQTWGGSSVEEGTWRVDSGKNGNGFTDVKYRYAFKDRLSHEQINNGFEVHKTGKQVNDGYHSGLVTATDKDAEPSSATAQIDVEKQADAAVKLRQPGGGPPKADVLKNAVKTTFGGTADAGYPTDSHRYHSADSTAGVRIPGTVFKVTDPGDTPVVEEAQGNVVFGGASSSMQAGSPEKNKAAAVKDPIYAVLFDLTTDESFLQEIMSQNIEYQDATIAMDDGGIRLTIDRNDPLSFVDLSFASTSPWVLNPYTYGARLDALGLSGYGFLSSGWTIEQDADRTSAFYSFGSDGLPLDYAMVQAPAPLLTVGHDYELDFGSGNGVSEVASAPEPSTLVGAVLGVLGLLGAAHRRRGRRPDPA